MCELPMEQKIVTKKIGMQWMSDLAIAKSQQALSESDNMIAARPAHALGKVKLQRYWNHSMKLKYIGILVFS